MRKCTIKHDYLTSFCTAYDSEKITVIRRYDFLDGLSKMIDEEVLYFDSWEETADFINKFDPLGRVLLMDMDSENAQRLHSYRCITFPGFEQTLPGELTINIDTMIHRQELYFRLKAFSGSKIAVPPKFQLTTSAKISSGQDENGKEWIVFHEEPTAEFDALLACFYQYPFSLFMGGIENKGLSLNIKKGRYERLRDFAVFGQLKDLSLRLDENYCSVTGAMNNPIKKIESYHAENSPEYEMLDFIDFRDSKNKKSKMAN
jgi:hypothetical protein